MIPLLAYSCLTAVTHLAMVGDAREIGSVCQNSESNLILGINFADIFAERETDALLSWGGFREGFSSFFTWPITKLGATWLIRSRTSWILSYEVRD